MDNDCGRGDVPLVRTSRSPASAYRAGAPCPAGTGAAAGLFTAGGPPSAPPRAASPAPSPRLPPPDELVRVAPVRRRDGVELGDLLGRQRHPQRRRAAASMIAPPITAVAAHSTPVRTGSPPAS